jgi:hypothetical protein
MFKDINKVLNKTFFWSDEENALLYSTLRYLFCRMMDVYDAYEKEFPDYKAVPIHFRDLLKDESEFCYRITKGRENYYVSVEDDDEYEFEKYTIPFCALEDDWKEKLKNDLKLKKITNLKKEIERIEKVLADAPNELVKLKNELKEIEN